MSRSTTRPPKVWTTRWAPARCSTDWTTPSPDCPPASRRPSRSTLVGGPLKGEVADVEVRVTKVAQQELPGAGRRVRPVGVGVRHHRGAAVPILAARLTNLARLEQAAAARDAVLEDLLSQVEIDVPENLVDADFESRKTRPRVVSAERTADPRGVPRRRRSDAGRVLGRNCGSGPPPRCGPSSSSTSWPTSASITVDQNDLTQHIIRRAQQENTAPQQIADHLQEHPHHIDEYMTEIRRGKALGVLVRGRLNHRLDGRAGRPRPAATGRLAG